jgi:hypothetical protein
MVPFLRRQRLLIASLLAFILSATFSLAIPATMYAAGENPSTNYFPSEPRGGRCQCGW